MLGCVEFELYQYINSNSIDGIIYAVKNCPHRCQAGFEEAWKSFKFHVNHKNGGAQYLPASSVLEHGLSLSRCGHPDLQEMPTMALRVFKHGTMTPNEENDCKHE